MSQPGDELRLACSAAKRLGYTYRLDGAVMDVVRPNGSVAFSITTAEAEESESVRQLIEAARDAGVLVELPPRLPLPTPAEIGDLTPDLLRESVHGFARHLMGEHGRIESPMMIMYIRRHPETYELLTKPEALMAQAAPSAMASDDSKDAYARLMRDLIRRLDAFAVGFFHEAWMVFVQSLPGESWQDARERMPDRLEDHHARRESILASVEHVSLQSPESYMARVTRGEESAPLIGEWERMPYGLEGRFAHWLRPRADG